MQRLMKIHRRVQSTRELHSLMNLKKSPGLYGTPIIPSRVNHNRNNNNNTGQSTGKISSVSHVRGDALVKDVRNFELNVIEEMKKQTFYRNPKEHDKIYKLFITIQKVMSQWIDTIAAQCIEELQRKQEKQAIISKFRKSKKFHSFLDIYILLKRKYLISLILSKRQKVGALKEIIGSNLSLFVKMYFKKYTYQEVDPREFVGSQYKSKNFSAYGNLESKKILSYITPAMHHNGKLVKKPVVICAPMSIGNIDLINGRDSAGSAKSSMYGSSGSGSSSTAKASKRRKKFKKKSRKKLRKELLSNLRYSAEKEFESELQKRMSDIEKKEKDSGFKIKKIKNDVKKLAAYEFKKIRDLFSNLPVDIYSQGRKPENAMENRYKDILPYDFNLIDSLGFYINCSEVQVAEKSFLCTQFPIVGKTDEKYWEMVKARKCPVLVNLQESDSKHREFWVKNLKMFKKYTNFIVGAKSITDHDGWEEVVIDIVSSGKEKAFGTTLINFYGWKDKGIPNNNNVFLRLIERVSSLEKKKKKGRPWICVNCSAGVGRTGVFVASYVLSQTDYEKEKIFDLVYDMRKMRNGLIQKEEQYKFLYDFTKKLED